MAPKTFKYVIVGAGLTGCHAIEGIRSVDSKGPILLIGDEKHLPYDRPPLTKKLWFGKKKVEEIFVHNRHFFSENNVDVVLNIKASAVNPANKSVACTNGDTYQYQKLLLATCGYQALSLYTPQIGERRLGGTGLEPVASCV